jgi:tRNA modification GTPase
LTISALQGYGLPEMLKRIGLELSARCPSSGLVGHMRQRRALEEAIDALARAENKLIGGGAEELAEDIRASFGALDSLVGRIGAEDILGAVFASFCLGK